MTRTTATRRWVIFAIVLLTIFDFAAPPSQTLAQDTPAADEGVTRFEAVDIYINTDTKPLAAYQVELIANQKRVQIAGVEGGEHDAFREPPFYDPDALSMNRVVVAAFSTADDLPSGKVRIARIHAQVHCNAECEYEIKLITAATSDGSVISPDLSILKVDGASDAAGDLQ